MGTGQFGFSTSRSQADSLSVIDFTYQNGFLNHASWIVNGTGLSSGFFGTEVLLGISWDIYVGQKDVYLQS